jgi:cytochrome c-type biogenesis protein CcmH
MRPISILMLAMITVVPSRAATLEEQARVIEGKLIAPCCWTQPVSQHYSQAAEEIRQGIRQMLAAGKSEQQILDYYVGQYGERILASPRARGFNLLAYILPWVFLVAASAVVVLFLRRWTKRPLAQTAPDTPDFAPEGSYMERVERELREP